MTLLQTAKCLEQIGILLKMSKYGFCIEIILITWQKHMVSRLYVILSLQQLRTLPKYNIISIARKYCSIGGVMIHLGAYLVLVNSSLISIAVSRFLHLVLWFIIDDLLYHLEKGKTQLLVLQESNIWFRWYMHQR